MTHETITFETPIDEIYRIRQEISAAYDHDPHKLFLAVVEQQKQRAREGQISGATMLPENWHHSQWRQSAARRNYVAYNSRLPNKVRKNLKWD